jgi:hypothetical protein
LYNSPLLKIFFFWCRIRYCCYHLREWIVIHLYFPFKKKNATRFYHLSDLIPKDNIIFISLWFILLIIFLYLDLFCTRDGIIVKELDFSPTHQLIKNFFNSFEVKKVLFYLNDHYGSFCYFIAKFTSLFKLSWLDNLKWFTFSEL